MPGLFGAIWLALQGVASIKDSIGSFIETIIYFFGNRTAYIL